MTMAVDKAIELALRANRQALTVLDAELARLANYSLETEALLAEANEDVMPAFFQAIGPDGLVGVPKSGAVGAASPAFGFISLAQDAPFVATSLVAFASEHQSTPVLYENGLGLQAGTGDALNLGFRLFDVANNSEIVNINRVNGANAQLAPLALLSSGDFAVSLGDWVFPETVFPKAASLRVEIYDRGGGSNILRTQVVLCGYKIFGD